ncbi:hypothetical protein FQN54_003800 [Arachnomyces sp. PD_36]|nr:hypothetical protein FQN54_003800 [Arachnomyces sp. PD_36]
MPQLLDLPLQILEDIVAIVLDCQPRTEKTHLGLPVKTLYLFSSESPRIKKHAHRLLLSSKLLNQVTSYILYSRSVLYFPTKKVVDRFVATAGESTLRQIRHISIEFHEDRRSYPRPPLEPGPGANVATITKLLSKLSSDLVSIRLLPPYYECPYDENRLWSHPALVEQLKRFSSLQDLHLDFEPRWLNLDLISLSTYRSRAPEPVVDPVPLPPMFPCLRHLHLTGCLNNETGPEDLRLALSQDQLPSLQVLVIDTLCSEGGKRGDPIFTPEAIAGMNPLVEFSWTWQHRSGLWEAAGSPREHLGRSHLKALHERHRQTLRALHLNYIYCDDFEDVPDREEFRKYLGGFQLRRYFFHCPAKEVVMYSPYHPTTYQSA